MSPTSARTKYLDSRTAAGPSYFGRTVSWPVRDTVYRASWFDGIADRDTGDFILDTPPPPIDIGFAMDSVIFAGRNLSVRWVAPDDSARMLSPEVFERRVPPSNWIGGPAYLSPIGWWEEFQVLPDTIYEFRAGWGDPAARRYSTAFSVRTKPEPRLVGIVGHSTTVDLRWSIRPGSVFSAVLHRFPDGDDSHVTTITTVTPTADGAIQVSDPTVLPGRSYTYYLTWDVGGVELRDAGYSVNTPGGEVPPLPGIAVTALANPTRGAIDCTLVSEAAGPVELAVLDITGRLRYRQVFDGPGSFPIHIAGPSWSSGLYLIRLTRGTWTRTTRVALVR